MRTSQTTTERVCLGYGRKSVVRNTSDTITIERQRAAIEELAAKRLERLEWFEDAEGHRSGRFERTRPAFMNLLSRIENDATVKSVIVYRIDRAGRSVIVNDRLIKLCQAKGIVFISIVDGIDTSSGLNAGEILRIQALSMASEYQANRASDDMRDAVQKFKKAGVAWGYTAFGLERVGQGYDARLAPTNDAQIVDALLSHFVTSPSYAETARAMNERGYRFRNRRGARVEFGVETVRTITNNVLLYSGYVVQGKWHSKSARIALDGSGTRLEQYARFLNATRSTAVTPIISPELASAVIERRYTSQIKYNRVTDTWVPLLTPMVYANGIHLRAQNFKGTRYYRGRTNGAWLDADAAEKQVLGVLSGLQFSPELRMQIKKNLDHSEGNAGQERARMDAEAAQTRLNRLQEMRLDGAITREAYNAQYAALEQQIRAAELVLSAPSRVDTLIAALADLGGTIEMMTRERQRRALQSIFERFDFDKSGELVSLIPREWARDAFGELSVALKRISPPMPSTGIPHDGGLILKLLAVVIIQSPRYFT